VFSNPALVGGRLRLPIEDLANMRSRSDQEDEPWFPTRQGDVVLLDGERPAVVEFQSTEVVRLRSPGGNRIVTPTAQFMAEKIEVLSGGYRVDLQFGLDYQNQAEITTTNRETFGAAIERRWRESPWASSLVGTAVEFSTAGPSSLDYFVRVDLDGSQAIEYAIQRRHLAKLCVEICNENGWVIPFQQLTVHAAPPRPE
jgi:small-conductance mechanosensitive channel